MIRLKTLLEQKTADNMQYQIRYIDGPVFYQRVKGTKQWSFISAEQFIDNVYDGELIKWDKKK